MSMYIFTVDYLKNAEVTTVKVLAESSAMAIIEVNRVMGGEPYSNTIKSVELASPNPKEIKGETE